MDGSPTDIKLIASVVGTDIAFQLVVNNWKEELPQHWDVGRAEDCSIRLKDNWVSNYHAVVRAEPMENGNNYDEWERRRYIWMIKDKGSTNGTYQDGVKVGGKGCPSPWILIEDGDCIFLGRTKLRFSLNDKFITNDTEPGNQMCSETEDTEILIPGIRPKNHAEDKTFETNWPGLAMIVLRGPDGIPDSLWWIFISLCTLIAVWLMNK